MDFTNNQKIAIKRYLTASKQHQEKEALLPGDAFLPMTNIFKAIDELNKCLTAEEVSYIIINRDVLCKQFTI